MATSATRRIYQIKINNPENLNNMQIGFCTSTSDFSGERQHHWCGKDADGIVRYFTQEYEPAILQRLSFATYDSATSATIYKGIDIGSRYSGGDSVSNNSDSIVIGNESAYVSNGNPYYQDGNFVVVGNSACQNLPATSQNPQRDVVVIGNNSGNQNDLDTSIVIGHVSVNDRLGSFGNNVVVGNSTFNSTSYLSAPWSAFNSSVVVGNGLCNGSKTGSSTSNSFGNFIAGAMNMSYSRIGSNNIVVGYNNGNNFDVYGDNQRFENCVVLGSNLSAGFNPALSANNNLRVTSFADEVTYPMRNRVLIGNATDPTIVSWGTNAASNKKTRIYSPLQVDGNIGYYSKSLSSSDVSSYTFDFYKYKNVFLQVPNPGSNKHRTVNVYYGNDSEFTMYIAGIPVNANNNLNFVFYRSSFDRDSTSYCRVYGDLTTLNGATASDLIVVRFNAMSRAEFFVDAKIVVGGATHVNSGATITFD